MNPTKLRASTPSLRAGLAAVVIALSVAGCGGGGGGGALPAFDYFTAVAVADLDGDGLPDVVATFTHSASAPPHPGFVAVYLQRRDQPGSFGAPKVYSVGNDPVAVAIGDLDGDGHPDIVTANTILASSGAGVSDVSVLRQNPAAPGQFRSAESHAVGAVPHDVAIGDLDGDGRPDLAVADSEGLSVLVQSPVTPGAFLPRVHVGAGGGTSSVAIADLDGDGRPDLLATNLAEVLVLYGIPGSDVAFEAPWRLSAGAQPLDAAASDLDGDGRPDIAVANYGTPSDPATASASMLLHGPDARGSFAAAVRYATAWRSAGVAIADLDGDGRADLAIANRGSLAGACPPDCGSAGTSVSVLLQQPAGRGRFLPAQDYPAIDDFVQQVAVADIDGDGRNDLVIAQSDGVFVRLQDPAHAGRFLSAVPLVR